MKEFFQLMRRFVSPYKKYLGWAIVLNVLSAVFNVFSFSLLIPILNILFKTGDSDKVYTYPKIPSRIIGTISTRISFLMAFLSRVVTVFDIRLPS